MTLSGFLQSAHRFGPMFPSVVSGVQALYRQLGGPYVGLKVHTYVSVCLSVCQSTYLSTYLIYPFIHPSIYQLQLVTEFREP